LLSDCLWTLDRHHDQFSLRACLIPEVFSGFTGFNDWRRKKHKKPQLTQVVLDKHISSLSDYLMRPWFSTSKWQSFWSSVDWLDESLYKYKTYLKSHCENVL